MQLVFTKEIKQGMAWRLMLLHCFKKLWSASPSSQLSSIRTPESQIALRVSCVYVCGRGVVTGDTRNKPQQTHKRRRQQWRRCACGSLIWAEKKVLIKEKKKFKEKKKATTRLFSAPGKLTKSIRASQWKACCAFNNVTAARSEKKTNSHWPIGQRSPDQCVAHE